MVNSDNPSQPFVSPFTEAAPQQLSPTEAFFATALDQMAEGFVTLDTFWRFTYANHRAELILGQPRTVLIGQSLWSAFQVDSTSQLYRQCHQALIYRSPVEFEEFYQALNRWFAVRLFPTERGLSAYFLDTTNSVEHKLAELEGANTLRREHDLLKAILDNVQAGIVACDAEGILTLFNPAARAFHGLPERPIPPDQWADYYDLYLPDGKTRMQKAEIPLFRALQGQTVRNVEMMIIPKQGTARLLLANGQAITTADEQQGAVVVMHDVTEQKQAEAALRKTEQQYRSVVDNVKEVIFQTSAIGCWTFLNPAWVTITGFTIEESNGRPVADYIHPDDHQYHFQQIQSLMQRFQEDCRYEVRYRTQDGGYRWIEVFARLTLNDEGAIEGISGTLNDVTERRQAEAERTQRIREQMARSIAEAAQQQSAFLAEVSAVLASSLDYERTLQSIAELAVPYFADWCSVDLLNEDQSISRVAVAHQDPEKVQLGWDLSRCYPRHLHDGYGIAKIIQTGQTEIYPTLSEQQITDTVPVPDYLKALQQLNLKSCILAPLEARGRVLGSISFAYAESNRHYSAADLPLAEDLASRAAIAIDNAWLYRQTQRAQAVAEQAANRTARLQQVTAALSESLTPAQVAEVIVDQGMAALNANFALVALLNSDGTELEVIQMVSGTSAEDWQCFPVDAPVPLAEAVRTQQPIWAETTEHRIARYPHLAEAYTQATSESWISIPLMIKERVIGGLSLGFADLPQLSEEDRAFILALAQQSAQAIDRACLYDSEQKARAEAEAANQVKDQFLAIVSHELRTPLNAILGWSHILRTRQLDEVMMARALETIERNAKSQNQLIDDLLDVSRILRGKLKLQIYPLDLTAVIETAVESFHLAALAKQIDLKMHLDPTTGTIAGDPERLQQIIFNLISNALKFTPQGGRIEIWLEPYETYAQLQVKDTGTGIHPDFLPHIFEYFRQADGSTTRTHGGLGLGLAIVRNLVELHGGTVQADSAGIGQGSTFTVRFPLLTSSQLLPDSVDADSTEADLSSTKLAGLQILVVDDEVDAREFIAFVLKQFGAEVTMAASAAEALEIVQQNRPHLLISDIGMPDMDGYALIQQMRSTTTSAQTLPAIALTAYAGEEYRKQAIAAGFQDYLAKPVEIEQLVQRILILCG